MIFYSWWFSYPPYTNFSRGRCLTYIGTEGGQARDLPSFHVRISMSLMRYMGVINRSVKNETAFKDAFYKALRKNGRINNPDKMDFGNLNPDIRRSYKNIKRELQQDLNKAISEAGWDRALEKKIRDELLEVDTVLKREIYKMNPTAKNTSSPSHTKKATGSPSDLHYRAKNRFVYKGVMQVFNLVSIVEAWGNLPETNINDTIEERMLVIAGIVQTNLDTLFKGALLTKFVISAYAARKSIDMSAALTKIDDVADKLGIIMAAVGAVSSFLQAKVYFDDGRIKDSFIRAAEGCGAAMVLVGYLLKKTTAQAAMRVAGVLMPLGNIIILLVMLYDIGVWIWEKFQPEARLTGSDLWKEVRKSTYTYWIEVKNHDALQTNTIPILDFYFPGGKSPGVSKKFQGLRKKIGGASIEFMGWEAAVPLYREGFSMEFIHGSVGHALKSTNQSTIQNHQLQIKILTKKVSLWEENLKHMKDSSAYKSKVGKFEAEIERRKDQLGFLSMDARRIIEFYLYLVSDHHRNGEFDNGNTFIEVARKLEAGTFIPDASNPEILPIQKVYTGKNFRAIKNNPKSHEGFSQELVVSRWPKSNLVPE